MIFFRKIVPIPAKYVLLARGLKWSIERYRLKCLKNVLPRELLKQTERRYLTSWYILSSSFAYDSELALNFEFTNMQHYHFCEIQFSTRAVLLVTILAIFSSIWWTSDHDPANGTNYFYLQAI